jgi:hypothetical protein
MIHGLDSLDASPPKLMENPIEKGLLSPDLYSLMTGRVHRQIHMALQSNVMGLVVRALPC